MKYKQSKLKEKKIYGKENERSQRYEQKNKKLPQQKKQQQQHRMPLVLLLYHYSICCGFSLSLPLMIVFTFIITIFIWYNTFSLFFPSQSNIQNRLCVYVSERYTLRSDVWNGMNSICQNLIQISAKQKQMNFSHSKYGEHKIVIIIKYLVHLNGITAAHVLRKRNWMRQRWERACDAISFNSSI